MKQKRPSVSAESYRRLKDKVREKTISCLVCGRRLRRINTTHLRTHGLTTKQYRRRYGVKQLSSEETRYRLALANLRHSEQELFAFIRRRWRSGEALTARAIRIEHRPYYLTARQLFRHWYEAVEAAGVDRSTKKYQVSRGYWTRARVREEIRRRVKAGKSMAFPDLIADDPALYSAAHRLVGGLMNALRDAGYDPRQFRESRSKWSPESVIRSILAREAAGLPLSAKVVLREDPQLNHAAYQHFGNWCQALLAAGILPDSVSRKRTWTPQKIVDAIRAIHFKGLPLHCVGAYHVDAGLVTAARVRFGSWDKALQAVGFDPALVRLTHSDWTRHGIIQAIRERVAAGLPVTSSKMEPPSATSAARRLFGSWDAALKLAGVCQPDPKARRWPRSAIIRQIKDLANKETPLNYTSVSRRNKALLLAASRKFGNWDLALLAAGVDPAGVRRKLPTWSADSVLVAIRDRAAAGRPLNSRAICPESLAIAGRRLFGGWSEALRAAGVDHQSPQSTRGQANARRD